MHIEYMEIHHVKPTTHTTSQFKMVRKNINSFYWNVRLALTGVSN